MCTVTFIPRDVGYYLAMNRDEQRTRIAGLPPEQCFLDGRAILCPSEPGGGTWISLNDARACFALINWYSVSARVTAGAVSRGAVINSVCAAAVSHEADMNLTGLPLNRINPFRLIGIFPEERTVEEWRWDLKRLARHRHDWQAQQWISSGHNEPEAQRVRGSTFAGRRHDANAGTIHWLRQLHGSHAPERGPFSTCMHREDAQTVSYTEVRVEPGVLQMNYRPEPPCCRGAIHSRSLAQLETC